MFAICDGFIVDFWHVFVRCLIVVVVVFWDSSLWYLFCLRRSLIVVACLCLIDGVVCDLFACLLVLLVAVLCFCLLACVVVGVVDCCL